MFAKDYNVSSEKFVLVNENKALHDKELVTKPVSYFRDAFNRFCKNKGAIVSAIIIGILVLYAIIAPIFSQYTVSYTDNYYRYTLPKLPVPIGEVFDGCAQKDDINETQFLYYYAIGQETGHNAIKNQKYKTKQFGSEKLYSFRLDSYESTGVVFKNVTVDEYKAIQAYQDKNNVQIIYPATQLSLRPKLQADKNDANFWYETISSGSSLTKPADLVIDSEGKLTGTNIYIPYDASRDAYTSKRIEGDVPQYNYGRTVDNGYEIRVSYHEYYKYYHREVLKDGVKSALFLFGTNAQGKDLFTCLASGARFSFILAIVVATVNLIVGAIYGAIEGYYGGKADLIMERISDILSAVPFMIVITLLKYKFEKTPQFIILFIAFFLTGWIGMSGTVRMQFYRFKNQEYVLAARTLGAKDLRIMFKHIFPNALGTIVTSCVLVIPGMIFSETSLSYLGIINLETGSLTSVGTLLASGQKYLTQFPHMIVSPALFICLLMLSFNLVGNGLRDAFNPSLRGTED